MPTSEVIKRLNAYGLEVKAAATAVDEKLADAALTGKPKPKAIAANGAAKKAAAAGRPAARRLRPRHRPRPARGEPRPEDPAEAQGQAQARAARQRRRRRRASARPTRSSLQGERAPGVGRRRPPRRHRLAGLAPPGSRRRSRWRPWRRPRWRSAEAPAAASRRPAPARHLRGARRAGRLSSLKADVIRVNSGSTVKDVAEYLGVGVPEVIKKLMGLGEMATLTQTLSDDAIQVSPTSSTRRSRSSRRPRTRTPTRRSRTPTRISSRARR